MHAVVVEQDKYTVLVLWLFESDLMWNVLKIVSEYDWKYYNHKQQTNLLHREEEPNNNHELQEDKQSLPLED